MAIHDKRVLGRANTLYEPGVDFNRLRRERLAKVQHEMVQRDIGAMLLTDIMNIRYATGISIMPLWYAVNLAHYTLIPAEGEPILYEYSMALFRAEQFWSQVHPAYYWQARFADQFADQRSDEWAGQIADILREWGVADAKLAVDLLDYHGFNALQKQGLTLTDADAPMEAARIIKTMDEIELLRQSAAVAEAALYDLEMAIRPGITEHELLGVFWNKLLAMGGEYCFTRLLVSGHKTNPWFNEASSKMVRPGDLVGIDTDMIGPEGYVCDVSRTFLCGDKPTPEQIEAYQIAHDFVEETIELCQVGVSYAEVAAKAPKVPEAYMAQRYPIILHGIGTDDEPPNLPHPQPHGNRLMPEGEFRENMVVSVECYAGKEGAQDGVKLEDEIWITPQGPVVLSLYPHHEKLLGR